MKKPISLSISLIALLFFGFTPSKSNPNKVFEKFLKKSSYILIPSGKAFVNGEETTVQSFYISKGEVTNFEYKEFLSYLRTNNEIEKLKICQIDTMNWYAKDGLNKIMSDYYHSHPAYNKYPVVNISHEAAELYCAFVSEALAKNFPGHTVVCRLPSYSEYVRAARGDDKEMPYAWNSHTARNNQGQILGNFLRVGEECITRNPETGEYEVSKSDCWKSQYLGSNTTTTDVLAPSQSYWANQFGVYNLSGNAAEMIAEKGVAVGGSWNNPGHDVRIDSRNTFEGTDRTVGFRVVFTYGEF